MATTTGTVACFSGLGVVRRLLGLSRNKGVLQTTLPRSSISVEAALSQNRSLSESPKACLGLWQHLQKTPKCESSPFAALATTKGRLGLGLGESKESGSFPSVRPDSRPFWTSRTYATTTTATEGEASDSEGTNTKDGDSSEGSGDSDSDVRSELLRESMKHVASLGFTMQAIQTAGKDLGYSRAVANILPGKEYELIEYFLEDCRAKMNSELQDRKEEIDAMRVRDKIAEAVRIRLKLMAPYVHVWPKVLYTMSQPPNVAGSLCQLHNLMDDMWHAAGDKSTDLNWYSKRMLLAGVYTSSELFMLTDSSPEFEETWHYVDRSIDRVLKMGKAGNDLLSMFKNFAEGSNKTTQV